MGLMRVIIVLMVIIVIGLADDGQWRDLLWPKPAAPDTVEPPPDLTPVVPPPVVEAPPPSVPVPLPTPKPRAEPKPAPKPVAKSKPKAGPSSAVCAQIAMGITMLGRDGVRAEARKRGYSESQITWAQRGCGY